MRILARVKARLLADPNTRAEYDAQAPGFAIACDLIAARVRAGLTQSEAAVWMQATQSTIAQTESVRTLPPIRTRSRYAEATARRAFFRLEKRRA